MRRIGRPLIVVVLFAAIAACSGRANERAGGDSTATPSTSLPSRAPSVATPLPSATSTVLSALERAINRVVPAGFSLVASGSGVLDVEGAAALAQDPAKEKAALQRNGFVRAYSLLWTRNNEASIAVLGYEFRASQGAATYERYTVDDAVKNSDAERFDVPDIEAATGLRFVDNPQQPGWYVRAVTFVRGAIRFGVSAGKPTDPDTESVIRLAEALEAVAR